MPVRDAARAVPNEPMPAPCRPTLHACAESKCFKQAIFEPTPWRCDLSFASSVRAAGRRPCFLNDQKTDIFFSHAARGSSRRKRDFAQNFLPSLPRGGACDGVRNGRHRSCCARRSGSTARRSDCPRRVGAQPKKRTAQGGPHAWPMTPISDRRLQRVRRKHPDPAVRPVQTPRLGGRRTTSLCRRRPH